MTKAKKLTPHPRYHSLTFKVKETVLTTQPKCMPVNLAEEKEKFIRFGNTPRFQLQDPSKLAETAEKIRNRIRFDLQGEAQYILERVLDEYGDGEFYLEHAFGPRIMKDEATPLLLEYISENSLSESLTIHWCDNLACSAKMMWRGPVVNCNRPDLRKYSLWINGSDDNNYLRESGIRCLMDHEIGTHFFRMLNDGFQPWFSDRAKFGLRNLGAFEGKCTEEGLATINTVLRGRVRLLWGAAFAYYTACKSAEMTFKQLFDHIGRYTSNQHYRWKQVMRVKRGLMDPNDLGGFGNDQCYFEGAVNILRNMDTIDFYLLMSGKVCYDELDRIKRVVRKECLRFPTFMHKMNAYRKSLKQISMQNGLDQHHTVHNPPAAYLLRLGERKGSISDGSKKASKSKVNEKPGLSKRKRNQQVNKFHLGQDKSMNNDESDDMCEIESFKISSRFVNQHQFQEEETKRQAQTCQIYQKFENVTNELTILDSAIEQKIKDLRNIVKEHHWSSNDSDYKESLLNEATCELKLEASLVSFEASLHTLSAVEESSKDETCSESFRPRTSVTIFKPKYLCSSKIADIKKPLRNRDLNMNRCQSKYLKKQQISTYPASTKQEEAPSQSKLKKKKKSEVLTESKAREKVTILREKFLSEVRPDEVILVEMSDVDDNDGSCSTTANASSIRIDIDDEITTELPQIRSAVRTNDQEMVTNNQAPSEAEAQAVLPLIAASTKQVPNFILRNKLLARRASLRSSSIGSAAESLKLNNSVKGSKSDESSSDSDSSTSRRRKLKKTPWSYIVSQYAQHKPVVDKKPKPDREFLTADLCMPFYIQAERILQAEKVLRKTRSRKAYYPVYKL